MLINRRHLIILTIAAFIARLPLMFEPMWYDEQYTLILSRLPFVQMLAATAGDVHPPLHYLIEWAVTQMGAPAWALRVPSLLFSLASIWLLAFVMPEMRIRSKVIQWGALALMAFAPMQIHYGTEARMYAMLMFLTLAGAYTVLQGRWVWTFFIVVALSYTQNWGLFYAATLALLAIVRYRSNPDTLRLAAIAFLGAALCWQPWASVLMGQMGTINQTYWITRVSAGQVFYQIYQQVFSVTLANPVGLVIFFGVLALGIVEIYKQRGSGYVYLLAFAPVVMAVIVSLAWQPVLLFRAMIGISPFLYIILAASLKNLYELIPDYEVWDTYWNLSTRRALLAMIVLAPLMMLSANKLYGGLRGDNDLFVSLAAQIQPGDTVVASNDGGVVGMRAITGIQAILVKECKPALGSLSPATRAAMDYDIRAWDQIPSGRVWLVWAQTPLISDCEQDMFDEIIGDVDQAIPGEDVDFMHSGVYLLEK